MEKMFQIFIVLFTLFIIVGCEAKVTDPTDPRFDPMLFDFNDYQNHEELTAVLKALFEVGDSKEKVERFFVVAGKGYSNKIKHEKLNYPLAGHNGLDRSEYKSYQKRIQETHEFASETIRYSKEMDGTWSPAVWQVFVFFDEKDFVQQIMSQDILIFGKEE